MTANATANQGRSSGGQVSLVTKSGTNEIRGSVYEYHRNTITTANDFFNNSTISPVTNSTLPRPKLIRNVFGASVGGPIQKNRMFFFVNFENTITRRDEPVLRVVPSQLMRQGILQYRDAAGAVQRLTADQLRQMDPLSIGANPAVLSLLQRYPVGNDPTQGGDGGLNFIGYRFNAPIKGDRPAYIARLDYTSPDNKHLLFVRGALADWKEDEEPQQFPGQGPGLLRLTNSKGTAIGHTWTIGPTLINDFRWGFTRQGIDLTGGNTSPGLRLRGIDNVENFDFRNSSRKIPTHNFTEDLTWIHGRHTLQFGGNFRNITNKRFSESRSYAFYHANNGWATNLGRNVLPQGIQSAFRTPYVRAQMAIFGMISQADITYFYNRDGSVFPRPHIPRREFVSNEYELYAQDQWKLSTNTTLTLGLRYSYFAPPYEKNGFMVRADFDVNEWFAARRDRGAVGIPSNSNPLLSFVLGGKGNSGAKPFFDPDRNNFAPRFALAWSPAFDSSVLRMIFGGPGQSSIRFGGSLFYDRTGGTFPVTTDLNGAVGLATFLRTPTGSLDYATAPRFSGLNNLSALTVPAAPRGGFPATLPPVSGNTGFMVDSKLRTPYSTTFNFSFSRDLPGDFTVEAAYVGRLGRKLMIQNDFAGPLVNFKDPVSGQTWVDAMGIVANLIDSNVPTAQVGPIPFFENMFRSLSTATRSATQGFYAQALGWAPSWTDLLIDLDTVQGAARFGKHTFFQQQFDWLPAWTNLGQSSYHSLQFITRKRFSQGLQADFNYTFSKSLDNGSAVESEGQGAGQILNAFNHRQGLGRSNFDITHQLNTNFVYELPVGRERALGSGMNPVLDGIVGGWQLSGLVRWRTGFPFSVGNGFNFPTNYFITGPASLAPGATRPDTAVEIGAKGGPNIFSDAAKAYSAFRNTRSGFSGNRNVLTGPGFFTLDTGVHKTFRIGENRRLTFRWETFNLTNTVSFDGRPNAANSRGIDIDLDSQATFGKLRSTAGNPRVMQFALRFEF